jgi:mRNA deadenylase 3'-5' endonuclease subunit Ccr4
MNMKEMVDLSLMSWNILAPCWVEKDWYPSLYKLAADYQIRINKILSEISLHNCNIVSIQEAQEDIIDLLKQKLGENCLFEFASRDPAESAIPNGVLTLIHKDWKYSNEIRFINGILDPIQVEAIQIIHIPSKKILFS